MNDYISVSDLTFQIKETLELGFETVSVVGEISNFKKHISGHWYFSLKDSDAQINCAMWRGFNNYVFFSPEDGMKVRVNGKITVYPPRGTYQIDVRSMKPAGVGELQEAFERLKKKLSAEGLFDNEFKKPIPRFPNKIGIVTAIGGAALQDMINIAKRRYPAVELIIAPAKVQGEGAADEIAEMIEKLNKRDDIDTIIIGRGGGSLEDLWAFNEEIVARAVFVSRIPIISGVGHEIDFTISDFVSDLRAPTPSAAMELATPNRDDLIAFLEDYSYNNLTLIKDKIEDNKDYIERILKLYGFRLPQDKISAKSQYLDNLFYKIENNIAKIISDRENKIRLLESTINSYNVEKTLNKGFTLIKQNGKFVDRAEKFSTDKNFKIKFYDKEVEVKSND